MKKIAIYGAGSLGTILGAYLRQAGLDVDLISRNKEHVEVLNQEGATVVGTVQMNIPVRALLPEEMTEPYDLIFLLTKQQNNKEVVKSLVPFLNPNGILCTMQNGLPEIEIAKVIGEERVMGCTVSWGATLLSPGVSELTSEEGHLTFGLVRMNGMLDDKLNKVKRILEQMGPVETSDNFLGVRWAKLIVNSAFSGMSTVLGCTFGEAAEHKVARRYIQQIFKECIDVAHSQGIKLAPIQGENIVRLMYFKNPIKKYIAYRILPMTIKNHRLIKASMLHDLEKGKPSEIDLINGIVSDYGKKYGVPTPYSDKIIEIVHGIERKTLRPCFENLALFKK